MISDLTEDQAKLNSRKTEIEAELEKLNKKRTKAQNRVEHIEIEIENLKYKLIPLQNGFWNSKQIIGEPRVRVERSEKSKSFELAQKERRDDMWDTFLGRNKP